MMVKHHDRRKFIQVSTGLGAGLALCGPSLSAAEGAAGPGEARPFFDVIKERRSVRKYKPTPVPEEHITQILEAARSAPTSGNQQPWKFLVLTDPGKIKELKEACIARSIGRYRAQNLPEEELTAKGEAVSRYFNDYLSAPAYIVVLVDSRSKYPSYNVHDGPLAAGYLILAARALGYGTVYATDSVPDEVTRDVLNIPHRYQRVCFIPLGVPEAWPSKPPKKSLAELVVYNAFEQH